jgi:hypothetical protein
MFLKQIPKIKYLNMIDFSFKFIQIFRHSNLKILKKNFEGKIEKFLE